MKKILLGIKIDDITMGEAVELVHGWLKNRDKSFDKTQDRHYIVTPNPEMVVAAQKDPQFKKVLNDAHLSIPDGVGLKFSGKVKNTVYGTDFMEKLAQNCADWGFTVGLLGGRKGVAIKAAKCLKSRYPKLELSFTHGDIDVDENGKATTGYRLPTTDLLFVAFGPPKQEKWIANNLDKIPVKVAMGVGGAFDYISGQIPRAPIWIRDLGFEWLFRLVIQPWRIKRQLSLIKYLYLIIRGSP